MTKKIKIILLIIAIILLAGFCCLFLYIGRPIPPKTTTPSRLDDVGLVYAYKYWAGLCSNGKGEEGGCYNEWYFYDTGKLIKMSGFMRYGSGIEANPTVEKNLGVAFVDQIIKKIKESGLMTKDCPPGDIMDAGWDYQITVDGVKKSFHNPLLSCQDLFKQIDKLINGQ